MSLLKYIVVLSMAIMFSNLTFLLGLNMFKSYERQQISIFNIFVGIAGMIIPDLIQSNSRTFETTITKGFGLGGFFLVLATVLFNWDWMDMQFKMCVMAGGIVALALFSHKVLDRESVKKAPHGKAEDLFACLKEKNTIA